MQSSQLNKYKIVERRIQNNLNFSNLCIFKMNNIVPRVVIILFNDKNHHRKVILVYFLALDLSNFLKYLSNLFFVN